MLRFKGGKLFVILFCVFGIGVGCLLFFRRKMLAFVFLILDSNLKLGNLGVDLIYFFLIRF